MTNENVRESFKRVKQDVLILKESLSRVIESQNQLFVLINELTEQQKRKEKDGFN